MSSRYFDINASDRAELEEIVKDVSFEAVKREIFDVVEIAVKGLNIDKKAEKEIVKNIIDNIEFEFPVQEFIDAIGLFDWEIFTRADCLKIEKALTFYEAFKQSKLPEFLKSKIKRGPRVKKLLKDKK